MNSSSVNTQGSVELRNSYCNKGIGRKKAEHVYSFYNRVFLLHPIDEPKHFMDLNSIKVPQRVGNPKQQVVNEYNPLHLPAQLSASGILWDQLKVLAEHICMPRRSLQWAQTSAHGSWLMITWQMQVTDLKTKL